MAVQESIRAGRRTEAEQACRHLVERDPVNVPALLLLGGLELDRGMSARALATLQRALSVEPHNAAAMLQVAVAQFRGGDALSARATLENLLADHPGDAVAAFHLALLCDQADNPIDAERRYREALTSRPDYRDALIHLGFMLQRLGRIAEALPLLERAWIPAQPRADLATAVARAHLDLGEFRDAVDYAQIATAMVPTASSAWVILGIGLRRIGHSLGAQDALERALTLAPDNVFALAELGCNEINLGEYASGLARLARARTLAPDWSVLRWLDALALPVLPQDASVVHAALERFDSLVDQLIVDLDNRVPEISGNALAGLERSVPFRLHYLPTDTTASTLRYAALVEAAMRHIVEDALRAPVEWRALAHGGRLRVGFVSCELRLHTITRYFVEWLMRLDRATFEIHAWHLGEVADDTTARIGGQVHVLHHEPRTPSRDLALAIRAAELDVLVYLEVGMDSRPQMLAALRLAPVQCIAYGHPVTSGLGNADWFLGSDAMEPPSAAQHYRERLERLPGLGVVPSRPPAPSSGDWLPREAGRPLLMCLQTLFKLTPDFDHAIARIAKATDAKIVFFDFPAFYAKRFRERASGAFSACGLDIDRHVHVLGRRDYESYLGGIAAADFVLDSIGFSGGATSLDAFSVGAPVVTVEAEFMRGRQTAAMLRILGVEELIAIDTDAYVRIAIDLCHARDRRDALRSRLMQHLDRLFEPCDVMPALAAFFQRVATAASTDDGKVQARAAVQE